MRARFPAPTRGATMTPSSAWRTLALTSVAVFVVSLDGTVLFVAFPAIRATFARVSAAQLSWVLNAYTIVFGALLVPAGRIADRVGRKRTFLLGLAVFSAASALCIVEGGGWGLFDPRTLASLAGGALLFVCFVLQSRTAASPAVDLSLFSNPTYRLANVATFAFAIAFTAMFFNFVFFLTQRWAYTLFQAGLAITPGPLVVIPVAIVAGRIADRR